MRLRFDVLVHKTDKALLLDFDGEEIWVPRSLAGADESELDEGLIEVPDWFVHANGLECYKED